jgi:hypothetical protein
MFDFGPVVIDHDMSMEGEAMGELDIMDGLRAMSMFKRDPGPLKPYDLNQEVKYAIAENPHCMHELYEQGFLDDSLVREMEQMIQDSIGHMSSMPQMIEPGVIVTVESVEIPEIGGPKKKKNIPTNPELYARVKAEAKRKFKVYPSAYANGWLVQEYKRRGGGFRKG